MSYIFEIGIRNAFKSKIRLMLISLLMCLGLTVISLSIGISGATMQAAGSLEDELQSRATVTVVNRNGNAPIPQSAEKRIRNISGIQSICRDNYIYGIIGNVNEEIGTDSAYIIEFDFEHQAFDAMNDYRNLNVSGVLIPEWYSEYIKKNQVKISFDNYTTTGGQILSSEYNVIGVYEDSVPTDLMQSVIYVSSDLYDDLIAQANLDPDPMSLILYLENPESSGNVIKQIEEIGFNAFANDSSAEDYLLFVKGLRTVGIVIGLLVVGLATVIILQALNASIRRREKAIGLMKAFGYKNKRILLMILTEVSVYALFALVLSIIAGMLLSPQIAKGLSVLFMNANYSYSIMQFGISLLIVVVFALLSIIRPWFVCRKLNPIDVLKENG